MLRFGLVVESGSATETADVQETAVRTTLVVIAAIIAGLVVSQFARPAFDRLGSAAATVTTVRAEPASSSLRPDPGQRCIPPKGVKSCYQWSQRMKSRKRIGDSKGVYLPKQLRAEMNRIYNRAVVRMAPR